MGRNTAKSHVLERENRNTASKFTKYRDRSCNWEEVAVLKAKIRLLNSVSKLRYVDVKHTIKIHVRPSHSSLFIKRFQ